MHLAALLATATLAAALSVETTHVSLASGQRMQWLACEPQNPKKHLVCIHGTFHGGWCFAEKWLPRLAERHGIAAHSISLRGTAGSPCADKSIKLATHARDVAEAIALQLPNQKLALCAHSFGGPVAIEALATSNLAERCEGLALLCSVPPSGNKPGTTRVLRRSLREAWLITKAFALKTAAKSSEDANAVFFNDQLDDETAARYTSYFAADSKSGLDLGDYQRSLPRWPTDDGRWASMPSQLKCLVLGADADRVVDREAVDESAKFLGVEPVMVAGPHDVMLSSNQEETCDLVGGWLTRPV